MDELQNVLSELRAVTREMALQPDLTSDAFAKLLRRRGELIHSLCSRAFDTSDSRVGAIVREGEALLARARSRRDSLRSEAASLNLLANLVGGMKSTLAQPRRREVDVTA